MAPKACPCFSGRRYADCCRDLHEGSRIAETPEALMRSRYSAFALGLGAYLVDTLAASHPDRAVPREALVRELSRAKDRQRFLGLRILDSTLDMGAGDGVGTVTFHARIFERGVDRSFTERSTFVREEGAWRYAEGEMVDGDG